MKTDQTTAGKRRPYQFFTRFDILDDTGSIYLTRYRLIQTPAFAIYLHKFYRADSDPYVHDHPWSFVSFVLRGGYEEMRRNNNTHIVAPRRIRWVNVMRRDDAHYVAELFRVPTWTLLFVGRRRRTWGFYVPVAPAPNQLWVEFDNWEGR